MNEQKDIDIAKMREIIEQKKQKSAAQGNGKRGQDNWFGSVSPGKKHNKKGGLPPK